MTTIIKCPICSDPNVLSNSKYCAKCEDFVEALKKSMPSTDNPAIDEFISLFNKHNQDEVDRAKLKELETRISNVEQRLIQMMNGAPSNILKD